MADSREPPPLFDNDDSSRKDEESEDLFTSAVESPQSDDTITSPTNDPFEGSDEIDLNDDDKTEEQLSKHSEIEHDDVHQDIVSLDDDGHNPFSEATSVPKLQLSQEKPLESKPMKEEKLFTEVRNKPATQIEVDDGDELHITVTDPVKVGDGMGAYMAYKVQTKTNCPAFKKKNFSVMRRFSDFLGLHDKLIEKHLHSGRIIPPAPEKSIVGMTKIKMSNQAEQGSPAEFVEKRRAALERYLNRTAAHPTLKLDPDFREFLEADVELPRATNTAALSGAGVMRLFNRVGETVNKMTYKMDESDPWFEEKSRQVENLDIQLHKLLASVEALVTHRRELCTTTTAFAKSAAMLSNCEEHTALSRAMSQLAEVEEKVEQLHTEQGNSDFFLLYELLKDYVALIGAVKDVFHQRVKVYQTWQHAQTTLTKKREQKAKLELAGKSDKISRAREEVIEWEAKVERGQEEFENISVMIRKEMERFECTRVKDFKYVIIKYMENLMTNQQQLIKYWEAFLPEAKAVA